MALGPLTRPAPPRRRLGRPARRRRLRRRRRAAALVVLCVIAAVLLLTRDPGPLRAPVARPLPPAPPGDVFAYRPGRAPQYIARAIAGEAHALFAESPGGVVATAARVAHLRPLIDAATRRTGIDASWLEGLVFVESAGRPDAIAGGDVGAAAGLTQILPDTARSMLGLRVDVPSSAALTLAIERARADGAAASVTSLSRRRAAVDQRFDPRQALAAAVRYLESARGRFGREDLAFVSYHMGMGNLAGVLTAYDEGRPVPYAQLFFDSAPDRHRSTYLRLAGFADQSSLYLWRVLAAAALMSLYRTDPGALRRVADLQAADAAGAAVLHPPDRTPAFANPRALGDAYDSATLTPLPANAHELGLAYAPTLGAYARRVHAPAALYGGLRPPALSLLVELAARVRALSGGHAPLTVAAAVSDERYQNAAGLSDRFAATGYTFTIARRYVAPAQARALQFMLDRLRALNLIAWTAYPAEIEVTAASDAARVIARGP